MTVKEKGCRLKLKHFRSWSCPIRVISAREIDIKLCYNHTKTYICEIWYRILSFKQKIFSKYATNLKTTISQRSLKNFGLLLLLFEFDNFSILIDIIDNIINTSVSHDQNLLLSRVFVFDSYFNLNFQSFKI